METSYNQYLNLYTTVFVPKTSADWWSTTMFRSKFSFVLGGERNFLWRGGYFSSEEWFFTNGYYCVLMISKNSKGYWLMVWH